MCGLVEWQTVLTATGVIGLLNLFFDLKQSYAALFHYYVTHCVSSLPHSLVCLCLSIFLQVSLPQDLLAERNPASDKSSICFQHLPMPFLDIVLYNI